MDDGILLSTTVQSLSNVSTTLQCTSTNTSGITTQPSISGALDPTLTPTHGAEVINTMCLEAGVMYETNIIFRKFGSAAMLLLDSVRT